MLKTQYALHYRRDKRRQNPCYANASDAVVNAHNFRRGLARRELHPLPRLRFGHCNGPSSPTIEPANHKIPFLTPILCSRRATERERERERERSICWHWATNEFVQHKMPKRALALAHEPKLYMFLICTIILRQKYR